MESLIAFAIALAISTGVLIVAMILTNKVLGGIDFGDVRSAALKASGLLIAVNLVAAFVPGGIFLSLPVWFIGLMWLFRLRFLEALVLSLINWGLNVLIAFVFKL